MEVYVDALNISGFYLWQISLASRQNPRWICV